MRLERKGAALAAAIILGSSTAAFAQIPNPLDWIFPHRQDQPGDQGQQNNGGCSTEQQRDPYVNACGEYVPGRIDATPGQG
jgi:hypothetical protein